jgi:hypothetical protein
MYQQALHHFNKRLGIDPVRGFGELDKRELSCRLTDSVVHQGDKGRENGCFSIQKSRMESPPNVYTESNRPHEGGRGKMKEKDGLWGRFRDDTVQNQGDSWTTALMPGHEILPFVFSMWRWGSTAGRNRKAERENQAKEQLAQPFYGSFGHFLGGRLDGQVVVG